MSSDFNFPFAEHGFPVEKDLSYFRPEKVSKKSLSQEDANRAEDDVFTKENPEDSKKKENGGRSENIQDGIELESLSGTDPSISRQSQINLMHF